MTTLQEAARKALYALEASIDGDHPYYEDQLTAIESLRTALAQQGEQAKPAAYITDTEQGLMVWTPEMYGEACTYCDDGEFPVPLYTVAPQPTSGDYALGYAEGFNDACKPAPQAQDKSDNYLSGYCTGRTDLLKEQSAQLVAQPLSDSEIEKLREKTFSTYNPYCPVDSKSMRKAVRAAEAAHGIGEVK